MEEEQIENQSEIAILIDGNNFFKGLEKSDLYHRFDLYSFDYERLATFIAEDDKITIKNFYKGVIKKEIGNPKSQRMVSNQQSLFSRLEKTGWEICRGQMSKNSEFGVCEGFYFIDKEVKDKEQLRVFSEEILKKYQFHYRPIIIISQNVPNQHKIEKVLKRAKEDGKELYSVNGVYFALNRWREKGVDVNIAINMVELAYLHKFSKNNINKIVLVSSDSDLNPVVKKVQSLGITVKYIGFQHMFSVALLNTVGPENRLLLSKKQLEEFFPKPLI